MINQFFIESAKYLYLAVILVAFIYFLRQGRATQKQMIILGVISLPAIYIVAKAIGFFYFDPRPFVVGHFTPLIPHAADNGFPSDHTLISAAFASLLFPFNKRISTGAWALTLVVGAARIYVGVHHFIDIFGAILIAMAVTFVVYEFIKNRTFFSANTARSGKAK